MAIDRRFTGKIGVPDGELAFELRGAGTPVVLLHGGALDRSTWDAESVLLAANHTVIRYDARGHGNSSTPTAPFAHHEDLNSLLRALELPSATLVGLSLGARTGIDFALTHPDQVERLVLVAPGISGMAFEDPFVLEHLRRIGESGGDTTVLAECFLRMWVDGPHRSPTEVDPALRTRCATIATANFTHHNPGGQRFATEVGAWDRLADLAAPTLLVVGDQDSTDIHGAVDRIAAAAPAARAEVVPGAGHMVNLERPTEFHRLLLDFLDQ